MADEIVAVEIREVEGFPGYGVSADGRVWTRKKMGRGSGILTEWRRLQSVTANDGRVRVSFRLNGKTYVKFVHRLVLTAFIGECPDGCECCHWDGNTSNNAVDNLRWDTRKNNHADKKRHGTSGDGESNPMATLTEREVVLIREMSASGIPQRTIARSMRVPYKNVNMIVLGVNWKNTGGPIKPRRNK